MTAVALIVAGGAGAVARLLFGWVVESRLGAHGTLAVNIAGALAAGFVAESAFSAGGSAVLTVGFLGGFTTFSTWMIEALDRETEVGSFAYLAAGMFAGIAAVAAGMAIGAM